MFNTDLIQHPERLLHGLLNFPLTLDLQVFHKQLEMLAVATNIQNTDDFAFWFASRVFKKNAITTKYNIFFYVTAFSLDMKLKIRKASLLCLMGTRQTSGFY